MDLVSSLITFNIIYFTSWSSISIVNFEQVIAGWGKCSKFYLQANLVSPVRIDIGVPYRNQKQPPEVFCKKAVLKNIAMFRGKHLCWSLFLINFQILRPATLLKRNTNIGVLLLILRIFSEQYGYAYEWLIVISYKGVLIGVPYRSIWVE